MVRTFRLCIAEQIYVKPQVESLRWDAGASIVMMRDHSGVSAFTPIMVMQDQLQNRLLDDGFHIYHNKGSLKRRCLWT